MKDNPRIERKEKEGKKEEEKEGSERRGRRGGKKRKDRDNDEDEETHACEDKTNTIAINSVEINTVSSKSKLVENAFTKLSRLSNTMSFKPTKPKRANCKQILKINPKSNMLFLTNYG